MATSRGRPGHGGWPKLAALVALLTGGVAGADDPTTSPAPSAADEARETDVLRSVARQTRSPVMAEDLVLSVEGHPALGRPEAALTLIEFSDLQCGFCRRHANSILPVLVERYVDTGRVRYVFFDFPIETRHPAAYGAAIAARCAADQSLFQPMRQRLLSSPVHLQPELLEAHAAALGADAAEFSRCLGDSATAEAVQQDLALGQQLFVRGTPTFFVGLSRSRGAEVHLRRRLVGAQTLDVFEAALDSVLTEVTGSIAPHQPPVGHD